MLVESIWNIPPFLARQEANLMLLFIKSMSPDAQAQFTTPQVFLAMPKKMEVTLF